jgi:superfamily II DNA or RNA helicase
MPNQLTIGFNDLQWPDKSDFPLNLSYPYFRTVESIVMNDILLSKESLIITGFTSLSYLIDVYEKHPELSEKKIRVVLGFDPIPRMRKKWPIKDFDTTIKDYWIEKGISPMQSGGVINLIESIKKGRIEFRYSDKIHAKIYVTETHATIGSSNFSINGLIKQTEANVRFSCNNENSKSKYEETRVVAENFYKMSSDYNKEIIDLLQQLLKLVTWPEALARAMVELLEGSWFSEEYPETFKKIVHSKLWPSQEVAISQALSIIDTQGSVLIADPTGSGKTKLVSTLQLALINRRWKKGQGDKANSMVICPPIIRENWTDEYRRMSFFQLDPLSTGILSYGDTKKHRNAIQTIKDSNILIIDEAHNFLNRKSARSLSIRSTLADCIMLVTATPINKSAEDLLRLIELLDVDNLNDKELDEYIKLRASRKPKSTIQYQQLGDYIKKFTVRRTKKQLNDLINKEPEKYINNLGKQCRFPKHNGKVYDTGETKNDIELAKKINDLTLKLKGLVYLRTIMLPFDSRNDLESQAKYMANRLVTAKALARYHIQAKLRSSKVALVEHIEGTDASRLHFEFKSDKNITGNILEKIRNFRQELPKNEYPAEVTPSFLKDLQLYSSECEKELDIYKEISSLAKAISDERELTKLRTIANLFSQHELVLAFDSTVLTLDYFNHLIKKNFDTAFSSIVVTGENPSAKERAKEIFGLTSTAKKHLGLCSDSMSEGVNLQRASAIVLLDMPSVLRVAEQRIGRLERMDSPHEAIDAYWPRDTDEFALRTDKKLIRVSYLASHLIGSNLELPEDFIGMHLDEKVSAEEMIKEFDKETETTQNWDGIYDAFQPVRDLLTGDPPLIEGDTYEYYKNVKAGIKCQISIVKGQQGFCFFGMKGSENSAPRWYLIDSLEQSHNDLSIICNKLKLYLKDVKDEPWSTVSSDLMKEYLIRLRKDEVKLLPNKKRRALKLLIDLMTHYSNDRTDNERSNLAINLLGLLKDQNSGDESIDYYEFMDYWLTIIQPPLMDLRKKSKAASPKTIADLLKVFKKKPLSNEVLKFLIDSIPFTDRIESKVISCILGISNTSRAQ